MKKTEKKLVCLTPTPGKQPTRNAEWKYKTMRTAILEIVPAKEPEIEFNLLAGLIGEHLSSEIVSQIGSLTWYTTTVKLDMEVKGELQRIAGPRLQRLLRMIDPTG
jgi:hypothetical protein